MLEMVTNPTFRDDFRSRRLNHLELYFSYIQKSDIPQKFSELGLLRKKKGPLDFQGVTHFNLLGSFQNPRSSFWTRTPYVGHGMLVAWNLIPCIWVVILPAADVPGPGSANGSMVR